jgi:hypothetical protein
VKITISPKIVGQMNLDELEKVVAQARAAQLPGRSVVTVRLKGIGRIREISVDGDNLSYESPFERNDAQADVTPDTSEFR